jgi:hypothetical protein
MLVRTSSEAVNLWRWRRYHLEEFTKAVVVAISPRISPQGASEATRHNWKVRARRCERRTSVTSPLSDPETCQPARLPAPDAARAPQPNCLRMVPVQHQEPFRPRRIHQQPAVLEEPGEVGHGVGQSKADAVLGV